MSWKANQPGCACCAPPPPPPCGQICFRVNGCNGAALSGATVTINGPAGFTSTSCTTSAGGTCCVPISPGGAYSGSVSATGFNPQFWSVTVPCSATTTTNVTVNLTLLAGSFVCSPCCGPNGLDTSKTYTLTFPSTNVVTVVWDPTTNAFLGNQSYTGAWVPCSWEVTVSMGPPPVCLTLTGWCFDPSQVFCVYWVATCATVTAYQKQSTVIAGGTPLCNGVPTAAAGCTPVCSAGRAPSPPANFQLSPIPNACVSGTNPSSDPTYVATFLDSARTGFIGTGGGVGACPSGVFGEIYSDSHGNVVATLAGH